MGKPHVLIIEDNAANLELMRYLLDAFGYAVESAADGESGIAAARRDAPDLIICDIQLPGISGIDVARILKAEPTLRRVPLVAVTAFAMIGDEGRLLADGFDGYISKPIDPEQFTAQIGTFIPGRLAAIRTPASGNESPVQKGAPNGLTVLAVDDAPASLFFAVSTLEHVGYRVLAANSADDAMRLARVFLPDLVVSDVCMPGQDGFSLLAGMKSDTRLREIPFVFLTSTARSSAERAKGLALGAAGYLFRPIEPQVLIAEVASCLDPGKRL